MNYFKLFLTSLLISSAAHGMGNDPENWWVDVDINQKNEHGRTALMEIVLADGYLCNKAIRTLTKINWQYGTLKNSHDAIRRLVADGALVTLEDNQGKTVLNYAARAEKDGYFREDAPSCEFLMEHMLTIPSDVLRREFKESVLTLLCLLKKAKIFDRCVRDVLSAQMRDFFQTSPELSFAFEALKKLPNGEIKSYLQRKYFPDSNIYPTIKKAQKKKRRTNQ